SQKDAEAARAVFDRIPPVTEDRRKAAPTVREKEYLRAVRALYAPDSSKEEQDRAYMEAMKRLHETYPEDDEARLFYSLSILGSRDGERDFATYMRAAATAAPVFERYPDHPGAAHYLIHSFDDPVHAPLGLPAADAYSEIAPNAAHAQHMTSHIFVALGLWDRVVTANLRAQRVQDSARAANGQGPTVCGHYSSWLHYGRLMKGELREAETLMDACHARAASGESTGAERIGSRAEWFYFVSMRARHIVDTEDWSLVDRWTAEPPRLTDEEANKAPGIFGGPSFTYLVTNALAALNQDDPSLAEAVVAKDWGNHQGRETQLNQLRGLLQLRNGNQDAGVALLREAAASEEALPFEFGPPAIVKPSFELLGKALLSLGHAEAAAEALRRANERTPGRVQATAGLESSTGTDE
ncbi:MAG: hypothetical protein IIA50_03705, partial [Bacteroidetes bacterium]|nr:hypothetical protein [Bacteroidota bacterium]